MSTYTYCAVFDKSSKLSIKGVRHALKCGYRCTYYRRSAGNNDQSDSIPINSAPKVDNFFVYMFGLVF